jgi:hypothetical protein
LLEKLHKKIETEYNFALNNRIARLDNKCNDMSKGSAEFRKYQREKNMEFEEKLQELFGGAEQEELKEMPLE